MYSVENYSNTRFNVQFNEIRNFLQKMLTPAFMSIFRWGRLDWMMAHLYLNVERLPENALFKDKSGNLVGMVMYDTDFEDRWYVLQSISDECFLRQMIGYVINKETDTAVIKANLSDIAFCNLLVKEVFEKRYSGSKLCQKAMSKKGDCAFGPDLLYASWYDKVFWNWYVGQK